MREEMSTDDGMTGSVVAALPQLMDGVVESDSASVFASHPMHGGLFTVTPCSIEYQY